MNAIAYLLSVLTLCLASCAAFGQSLEHRALITTAALEHGIDPNLMLAIAKVESSFNPHAKGALGEIGLFQLRPNFHRGAREGDVRGNVRIAARYLAFVRSRCRAVYGDAWFVCFNHGPYHRVQNPKATAYFRRVTHELRKRGVSFATVP